MPASDELTQKIKALPLLIDDGRFWTYVRASLRGHVGRGDIQRFLEWSTIVSTMFVGHAPYIPQERDWLSYLDDLRWSKAVSHEFSNHPTTNLIHQAYHLSQWEHRTGQRVENLKRIVEIGGGYGAMCVVVRRLGFSGEYVICDFPEFSVLQEFYLEQMGVNATLKNTLTSETADLLIGLFSLTEMASHEIQQYLGSVKSQHYLIAGHDTPWEGRNPRSEITALIPGAQLLPSEVDFLSDCYYLIR